ncbi:Fe-S cluster assembly iron-binding protein IscA [Haloechinothrix alba]|uniref:Fe-S cluster assembly iron-binding protein IscA n=2 Tax=Haloechinothrix TaxID=1425377 RepID=A0A238WPR8_9PSEU|nr:MULTISPECIES: iron-sulfur cluster biosynthesis family protein [Haloechinothrix]MBA0127342.1 iron-sulfur cluster biosynthesis protein [Haloechinothrix aidingensis]SNR48313.1 Fe-S cluster assembly iron-binding protein IscA [Haloechinothrix alba]
MLAMTDVAAEAINALTEENEEQTDAGLRMAVDQASDGGAQLSLSVATTPEEGDQVVSSESGAKVFLEQQAAQLLEDKVLDVQKDEEGQLNFTISQQES